MLALYIILGFVAVLALIHFVEFGRVDRGYGPGPGEGRGPPGP